MLALYKRVGDPGPMKDFGVAALYERGGDAGSGGPGGIGVPGPGLSTLGYSSGRGISTCLQADELAASGVPDVGTVCLH